MAYGSADAGNTCFAENSMLNKKMQKAGKVLNLMEHSVNDKRIVGPGDIEGHLGDDGNFYIIDTARVMPPESPPRYL